MNAAATLTGAVLVKVTSAVNSPGEAATFGTLNARTTLPSRRSSMAASAGPAASSQARTVT